MCPEQKKPMLLSDWTMGPTSNLPPISQAGPGLREGTCGGVGEGQQGSAVWFGIKDPLLMVWRQCRQRSKTLALGLVPGPQLSVSDAATEAYRVPTGIGTLTYRSPKT